MRNKYTRFIGLKRTFYQNFCDVIFALFNEKYLQVYRMKISKIKQLKSSETLVRINPVIFHTPNLELPIDSIFIDINIINNNSNF